MGIGPVTAVPKALKLAGVSLDEIDLVELNEAFAVQALAVIRELGLDEETVNVNGGAIALGHPLGCTGAKLTVQMLHELVRQDKRLGLVTMCIGGGMGAAASSNGSLSGQWLTQFLATIHYPLSTIHYPLPTAHYPLSLPTAHYPLPSHSLELGTTNHSPPRRIESWLTRPGRSCPSPRGCRSAAACDPAPRPRSPSPRSSRPPPCPALTASGGGSRQISGMYSASNSARGTQTSGSLQKSSSQIQSPSPGRRLLSVSSLCALLV